MSKYIIESNIPVPGYGMGKTPLSYMNVGDSFVAPIANRGSIASTMSRLKKKHGKVYTSRSIDENNMRIWRVA